MRTPQTEALPRRARLRRAWLALALAALLAAGGCGARGAAVQAEHHREEIVRGPRGGRLFHAPGLSLELVLAEDGAAPEFRAYLYDGARRPVDPVRGTLEVVLERFGGREDRIVFAAAGDFFRGLRAVAEPHSFTARVAYVDGAKRLEWTFEQLEGRITLPAQALATSGIEVAAAGPRDIEVTFQSPGEVRVSPERLVQVRPRFAGVVRTVDVRLGDGVTAGQRVAVIHSNESLAEYEVVAPIGGTIVARDAVPGQAVTPDHPLCTIADLTQVWVDFPLAPALSGRVRPGQAVRIRGGTAGGPEAQARVHYVGPLLEQDSRVSRVRAALSNADGRWPPGLFVTASVVVDRVRAAVALPEEAIVRTARGPAVFRAMGRTFELQPVTTGRSDGLWTEVVEGLAAGDSIVVRQAFLLKAELGKSEAAHGH
uniref:HlyD family secretion protein n=1 Tax=Eiseniibacteriota bacterium TaxID=2212470 RepID=A0A832I517_UNCEI